MNKEQSLNYFNKENNKDTDDVNITNVVAAATPEVTNAELTYVAAEINKSATRAKKYQKTISEDVRKGVGKYALIHGTASTIKKYSSKYTKYNFIQTSVNNWKNKFKGGRNDVTFKKVGQPNILDAHLLC